MTPYFQMVLLNVLVQKRTHVTIAHAIQKLNKASKKCQKK